MTADVELFEEMFIITKETAEAYLKARTKFPTPGTEPRPDMPTPSTVGPAVDIDQTPSTKPSAAFGLAWTGEIPPMKWMNFYTKILSKFASTRGLKLTLKVELGPQGGVSQQSLDEMKSALRELGLNDDVSPK
jgi:hypothetical protein